MMLRISSHLLRQLQDHVAARPHEETCGLLLGGAAQVTDVRIAANVAPNPAAHFEIDPAVLIAAHRAARDGAAAVIGNWHSHPNGRAMPSAEDARCAAPDGQFWLILTQADLGCWRAVENGPLFGRFEQVALAVR